MTSQSVPYIINAPSIEKTSFRTAVHNIEPSCVRQTFSLDKATGLSHQGVHYVRVEPGKQSCAMHWHTTDEEWTYILQAGEGAVLRVWDQDAGETVPRELPIKTGDFIAHPAGVRRGHAIRAGTEEVVFICGGTRERLDVCVYPESGKTLVINKDNEHQEFLVEDKNLIRQ
jgi:uncharacterized cupin superfamily protein